MPPFHPRPLPRKPLSQATAAPIGLIGSVGDREENDPADLSQLARALGRLGDYRPEDYGRTHDEPAVWDGALVGALARFQEREGLKVDALARPCGPTERRLERRLVEQEERDARRARPLSAGERAALDALDANQRERLLREAGFTYQPDPFGRLGQGDWRDRQARLHSPEELDRMLREQLPLMRQSEGQTRRNEITGHGYLDSWAKKGWGGPRGHYHVPTLKNEPERIRNLLENKPARFNIDDNPDADEDPAWWELPDWATVAVREYDAEIEASARRNAFDPDIVRAVLWAETARGHKGGLDILADQLGYSDSQRPMNINSDVWAGLIGETPEAIKNDPKKNIEAATVLLKRIAERLDDPTPAKIGSIWNFAGKEKVSDFGAAIGRVYREKPWEKDRWPGSLSPGTP